MRNIELFAKKKKNSRLLFFVLQYNFFTFSEGIFVVFFLLPKSLCLC